MHDYRVTKVILLAIAAIQTATYAQAPSPSPLLTSAIAAIGSGLPPAVTLQGHVIRTAGSTQEAGTVTMTARSDGSGEIDFDYGSRREKQVIAPYGTPMGCSTTNDSDDAIPIAIHNCSGAALWFLPHIALPDALLGLHTAVVSSSLMQAAFILRAQSSFPSAMQHVGDREIGLDPKTYLPDICLYNEHPEDNALFDVEHEVFFLDYRSVNGTQLPFHIQNWVQQSLLLDITIDTISPAN